MPGSTTIGTRWGSRGLEARTSWRMTSSFRLIAETYATAERGEQTPLDMRLRNRLSHTFCTRLLVQAIDALFLASGGQGIFLEKPLQQAWRDAHAAASHISLNWDAVSTMYG